VKSKPTDSEWHVPPGRLSRPIPRFLYRLSAPLRWFRGTIAHTVGVQSYRFFLRTRSICQTPYPRASVNVPCDPRRIPLSIAFELACSAGMQRLQQEQAWCDLKDLQVYARAFREGAECSLGNACKCEGKEGN